MNKFIKLLSDEVIGIVMIILMFSIFAVALAYAGRLFLGGFDGFKTRELTEEDVCLEKYNSLTCSAIKVCGSLDNVKKITTGGFFEVGKGFECK